MVGKRTYNVHFVNKAFPSMGGGIACVEIEPTVAMIEIEEAANELELQSIIRRNEVFELGQEMAQDKFFAENPGFV